MGLVAAIGGVLGGLAKPAADYLTRRAELRQARALRRIELEAAYHAAKVEAAKQGRELDAAWERMAVEHSGWKDEYWTLVLSAPLVLCFFPGFAPDVLAGFQVIEATPEWYRYSIGTAIAAAFGVRPLVNLFRRGRR